MERAVEESHLSVRDYLEGEEISEIKHEYIAGRVYAMSGGTMAHQRIARNFLRHAGNQLSGKSCEPTGSDFKVHINLGTEEAFYYPDAMIVCEAIPDAALFTESPTVILEVLSPGTRRNDEVQKFRDYITIPSLKAYLLAEADSQKITIHRRRGEIFQRETIVGPYGILELPEVGISIRLADLYADVRSPEP